LKTRNRGAPHNCGDPYEVRLAASRGPAVQTLRCWRFKRRPLPRMKMKVQGVR
jgi:hypothetical protein